MLTNKIWAGVKSGIFTIWLLLSAFGSVRLWTWSPPTVVLPVTNTPAPQVEPPSHALGAVQDVVNIPTSGDMIQAADVDTQAYGTGPQTSHAVAYAPTPPEPTPVQPSQTQPQNSSNRSGNSDIRAENSNPNRSPKALRQTAELTAERPLACVKGLLCIK